MSAVQKKIELTPDAATLDLWRVAENGELDELASVLARVRDINARNEHGVTALMRAAQYGHVKMVCALLEHGAEANIKRNDKFTALALAAFFGHTEIVRVLMEHGADSKASTRYDTSPQMWATARTFNEVAHQLEKPAPVEKPVSPKTREHVAAPPSAPLAAVPAPTVSAVSADPVVRAVVKTAVVRTLKDPPEIWDLVHEVPRGFNARSVFVTRLKSIQAGLAFRLAAVAVLIGAGVVGVMVLSGVQARNEAISAPAAKQPPATMNVRSDTTKPEISTQPATTAPDMTSPALAPIENSVTTPSDQPVINNSKPGARWSRVSSHRNEPKPTPEVTTSEAVQPLATPPAKTISEPRPETTQKTKVNTPLSPQMIAPAKNAAAKGKVIQWP